MNMKKNWFGGRQGNRKSTVENQHQSHRYYVAEYRKDDDNEKKHSQTIRHSQGLFATTSHVIATVSLHIQLRCHYIPPHPTKMPPYSCRHIPIYCHRNPPYPSILAPCPCHLIIASLAEFQSTYSPKEYLLFRSNIWEVVKKETKSMLIPC